MDILIRDAAKQSNYDVLYTICRALEQHVAGVLATHKGALLNQFCIVFRRSAGAKDTVRHYQSPVPRIEVTVTAAKRAPNDAWAYSQELVATFERALLLLEGSRALHTLWSPTVRKALRRAHANVARDVKSSVAFNKLFEQRSAIEHVANGERARALEIYRRQHPRPKTRTIAGLRHYYLESGGNKHNEGALEPYARWYRDLFEAQLRQRGLRMPYDEIYVQFMDAEPYGCLGGSSGTWYEYAHAVIDFAAYKKTKEAKRSEMVLTAMAQALDQIATVDGLDRKLIAAVAADLKASGVARDVVFTATENQQYRAAVVYRVNNPGCEWPLRLALTDLATNKTLERKLGSYVSTSAALFIHKVTLKADHVRIDAGTSARARSFIKANKAPLTRCFTLDRLMPLEAERKSAARSKRRK